MAALVLPAGLLVLALLVAPMAMLFRISLNRYSPQTLMEEALSAANYLRAMDAANPGQGYGALIGQTLAVTARVFDFGNRTQKDESEQTRLTGGLRGNLGAQRGEFGGDLARVLRGGLSPRRLRAGDVAVEEALEVVQGLSGRIGLRRDLGRRIDHGLGRDFGLGVGWRVEAHDRLWRLGDLGDDGLRMRWRLKRLGLFRLLHVLARAPLKRLQKRRRPRAVGVGAHPRELKKWRHCRWRG